MKKCDKCGKAGDLCKCMAMSEKGKGMCKSCGDMHKSEKCMKGKSFRQMKDLEKDEHQPHPGPSKSGHQTKYDAKIQAASEAAMKTPKGEADRKARNAPMTSKMKKSLTPGMTYNDLRKTEADLAKAESEAMDLAEQCRAARNAIKTKLESK